jgi:glycosyltransferase involved in cell wall biosynthesis
MSDIAVFYLARLKEGFPSFDAFAQSLRRHPAGLDHDLIIICKGFKRRSEFAVVSAIFKGIPHQIIEVDDDIGQDIHSYKAAAARFPHIYACFMNTFTEFKSDDWLKKLFDALSLPRVGMVGATASFESLNNSWELLTKVQWLVSKPAAYDSEFNKAFHWMIELSHPPTGAMLRSRYKRLRRAIGDIWRRRPDIQSILHGHQSVWTALSSRGGPFQFAHTYPHFPNPHIRSNVFMLRREDLVKMPLIEGGDPKLVGCAFESGADGLSARILKRGERLLLVGANGRAYDIPEWANAGCFRSNGQRNLLATDNQTRAFEAFSDAERKSNSVLAWGSYLDGNPGEFYGVKFDNLRPLSDFTNVVTRSGKDRLFSIVIPTHNRLALLLDAIKTVTGQNFKNWEIAVFDNASTDNVGEAIRALGDDRIRCERSDEFLPVTESWNRALNMACGEYVTLIGDDDGLAPGFFERISELADRFEDPDVIFSALFQFFHPGVLPGHELGFVRTLPTADFMRLRDYPFLLNKQSARRAVDCSLNVRRSFMFNMPAFTVRREFLESMRRDGDVLHPPFPDYYFANLVFELAKKIVVEPKPIAFQGISTSSFGFTLFNKQTDEGFKVLGHKLRQDDLFKEVGHLLLPGSGYNSQYILTMAHLARAIGDPSRVANFKRYRRIQVYQHLESRNFPFRRGADEESVSLWKQLSFAEKVDAYYMIAVHRLNARTRRFCGLRSALAKEMSTYSFDPMQYVLNQGDFIAGAEVFDALNSGRLSR